MNCCQQLHGIHSISRMAQGMKTSANQIRQPELDSSDPLTSTHMLWHPHPHTYTCAQKVNKLKCRVLFKNNNKQYLQVLPRFDSHLHDPSNPTQQGRNFNSHHVYRRTTLCDISLSGSVTENQKLNISVLDLLSYVLKKASQDTKSVTLLLETLEIFHQNLLSL